MNFKIKLKSRVEKKYPIQVQKSYLHFCWQAEFGVVSIIKGNERPTIQNIKARFACNHKMEIDNKLEI